MAIGKFRLFYKHMDASHPCAGVHYRLVNESTGHVFSHGQTSATGETRPVETQATATTYRLEILNHRTGQYEAPDVDGVDGVHISPLLEVQASNDPSVSVQAVHIKPYFRVRFHTQVGNKPVVGARFTAYLLDTQGKEAVARDLDRSRPIIGTTNAQGEVDTVYCAAHLVFKFEIPGSSVRVTTARLKPLIKGQSVVRYDAPLKTVTAPTVPLKTDPVTSLTGKQSVPLIISPSDNELIAVPQSDYQEFEEITGLLEQVMANGHRAKLDLSRALESGEQKDIAAAEKALGLAQDKIKDELNKNFKQQADIKEVITYERLTTSYDGMGAAKVGLRRRYLSSDRYLQFKAKRLNKNEYKLDIKFNGGSATGSTSVNPKSLDTKALKSSFEKIKKELTSKQSLAAPDPLVIPWLDAAASQFSETVIKSETYEIDVNAQWLRLVLGAGASAEADWGAKKAEIQGNLQGKLVLCEGKTVARYAFPSLKGGMMQLAGEDLGAIRVVLSCELYGFAGAKFVASGAAGVSWQGLKQVVVGLPKDEKSSAQAKPMSQRMHAKRRLPVFDPIDTYEKLPEDLNGVKANIKAFAGAEGGITPGGQLQWLPPTEKDFVSFAEVSATLGGSAGLGFEGQLYVYFAQGKFRVRLAAGLCFGLGAKGALEFTVNAEKLLQFVKWVSYQLLNSGVRLLVYFAKDAFLRLSHLLLLLIQEGVAATDRKPLEQAALGYAYKQVENITATVDKAFEEWLIEIDQAKVRNQLVNNINRKPPWLVHATPETRGMLLYQITRHGMPSHGRNLPSFQLEGFDQQVHFLPDHKTAINNIMATVQTAREWMNVMEHMTSRGLKSKKPAGTNEGDVIRFLNNGLSLAEALPSLMQDINQRKEIKETGNSHLDAYLKMRNLVRNDFPKGYQVVRLDTPHLDIKLPGDGREHPSFAFIQTAEIGEAYAGDPGVGVG